MSAEIKCWTCEGSGEVHAAFKPISLKCFRCGGKGSVPAIQKEWEAKGRAVKDARVAKRITLRNFALLLKADLREVSDAEQGIIDPMEFFSRYPEAAEFVKS